MNGRSAVLVRPSRRVVNSGSAERSSREVAVRPPAARVREVVLQSFKMHVAVYLPVNLLLIAIWAAAGGGYFWPIWPILGWGVAVACHGAPLLALLGSRTGDPAAPRHAEPLRSPQGATSVDEVAATIGEEGPSMRSVAAPDGTVTMLFSDIEASTAVNERLGDVR